jgi:hypothetical protein
LDKWMAASKIMASHQNHAIYPQIISTDRWKTGFS